jgi:ADP-ribosyl-[dinitrogen reductase] hydrolase
MALCLATSLLRVGGFDAADQMNLYCDWWENGYLSSTGQCFDIGNTTRQALRSDRRTGKPFSGSTDPMSAGNGSIMRLAPVPMFYFPDFESVIHHSGESSRTTHGVAECVDACRLLGAVIFRGLSEASKEEMLCGIDPALLEASAIKKIALGAYRDKAEDEIRGSGYVVESLEAALWCFLVTDSFEDAILKAANLGDDADTTAAVCGQVAGAYYGEAGIPRSWLDLLVMCQHIRELADGLWEARCSV